MIAGGESGLCVLYGVIGDGRLGGGRKGMTLSDLQALL